MHKEQLVSPMYMYMYNPPQLQGLECTSCTCTCTCNCKGCNVFVQFATTARADLEVCLEEKTTLIGNFLLQAVEIFSQRL